MAAVLIYAADFIEDWFVPLQNRRELPLSDAGDWSEEETLQRLENATLVPESNGNIWRIDDRLVTKSMYQIDDDIASVQNHEALAMQLVRQHTRIPVPRLYRTHLYRPRNVINLIMDSVKGERLDHAWPKLSWLAQARVAWTLRSYVRQLRKIKTDLAHIPGPLGPRPLACQGYIWDWGHPREFGPFPDATALFARLESYSYNRPRARPAFEGFHKPLPLVFTHNDLCPRNIVLEEDGQVWVIDWGYAGFYPEFFEYMNMDLAADTDPDHPVPLS